MFCLFVFRLQDNRAISFDGMARACAEAMGKDPAGTTCRVIRNATQSTMRSALQFVVESSLKELYMPYKPKKRFGKKQKYFPPINTRNPMT